MSRRKPRRSRKSWPSGKGRPPLSKKTMKKTPTGEEGKVGSKGDLGQEKTAPLRCGQRINSGL